MEIAEDEEEDNRKRQSTVMEEHPPTTKAVSIPDVPESAQNDLPPSTSLPLSPTTTSRSIVTNAEKFLTEPPPPRSPTKTIDESQPRKSSQSTRPDMYNFSSYGSNGKPKVKLGPRPSLDVTGGRPHTSGAGSYRPVSTLPMGLKIVSRGSRKEKQSARPASTYNTEPPSMTISPPPIPDMSQSTPARPHTSGGRPPTTPNPSIKPIIPNPITSKSPSITPEKARLMKAMELRKKQMKAPPAEPLSPSSTDGLTSPTFATSGDRASRAPKEVHDTLAMLNDMAKEDDSGIAFDASSTLKTDESDATRSDSYPVSPVGPSEQAESTRASSISESTDETVQEASTLKPAIIEESPLEAKVLESMNVETKETVPESDVQLLPMTYQPPSKDVVSEEPTEAPEESEETTPVATLTKLEDPIAESSVVAAVAEEPKTAAPGSVQEPISPTESVKNYNIPRSKFSKENHAGIHISEEAPAEPMSPTKSELKIPRSKFSIENLNSGDKTPEIPTEPLPLLDMSDNQTVMASQKSPIGSTFSVDTKRSLTEDDQENDGTPSKKRKKRKGLIEPIRTDVEFTDRSGHNS